MPPAEESSTTLGTAASCAPAIIVLVCSVPVPTCIKKMASAPVTAFRHASGVVEITDGDSIPAGRLAAPEGSRTSARTL